MALRLFLFLAILIPYLAPSMPAWAGLTADIIKMSLTVYLYVTLLQPPGKFQLLSMPAWAGLTADIGALVYCMRRPRKFYVPILHLIVSYSAYAYALNGETKLPMVLYKE